MSRLEELIEKLCPDGVEYIGLGNICDIRTGKLNANAMVENGEYLFFTCDALPSRIDNYAFDTDAILISGNGSQVGHLHRYKGKFNAYQRTYVLDNFIDSLSKDFLFHFLTAYLKPYILINCKKGSVPYITLPMLQNFKIPVPPLEVQSEIVRILDNFTELTAELTDKLTAELTARKKQYEYYRDELLTFGDDVPQMRLGDTCYMKSGKSIASTQIAQSCSNDANIRCFGGNGVRGFVKEASHHGDYPIIGRQGALCGNVNFASGDFYATEHAVVVESLGKYNVRFLFYLLTAMDLNQYKSQGAQPGLAVGNIENLLAPVPPLEEQQRIVDILDRFDKLCNDISEGLPAEIEARQKQYEYYRDKLLTFKRNTID